MNLPSLRRAVPGCKGDFARCCRTGPLRLNAEHSALNAAWHIHCQDAAAMTHSVDAPD